MPAETSARSPNPCPQCSGSFIIPVDAGSGMARAFVACGCIVMGGERVIAEAFGIPYSGPGAMPTPRYGVWKHKPHASVWTLRDRGSPDGVTELATVGDGAYGGCSISSHPHFVAICQDVAAFVAWLARGGAS